jgi:predicted ATP-grasp superfamily ATP-dependent carboligase
MADFLTHRCVPVPHGVPFCPRRGLPAGFPYPAILKPADGAGSLGVQWLADRTARYNVDLLGASPRLEQYHPGIPASVAVLCGPHQQVALPACLQSLSRDGRFRYLGGSTPIPQHLDGRARSIAVRALEGMPGLRGYMGVDLVLGEHDSGRDDLVIEVNPRLTTSYIGLRHLADVNLAGAMLAIGEGGCVEIPARRCSVTFYADGRIA